MKNFSPFQSGKKIRITCEKKECRENGISFLITLEKDASLIEFGNFKSGKWAEHQFGQSFYLLFETECFTCPACKKEFNQILLITDKIKTKAFGLKQGEFKKNEEKTP